MARNSNCLYLCCGEKDLIVFHRTPPFLGVREDLNLDYFRCRCLLTTFLDSFFNSSVRESLETVLPVQSGLFNSGLWV